MNEPFALGNLQVRAELIEGRGQTRQQRPVSKDAAALDGPADRLVIVSGRLYKPPIGVLRHRATVRIEGLQDLVTRQKRGHRSDPCHRAMMAPRPRHGCRNDPGSDRVKREVSSDLQEIVVAIDEQALESTFEDVPHAPMSPIERLAVDPVELPESAGEVRLLGLEEQMIVIPHDAVGVTANAPTDHDLLENPEEGVAVDVIEKDRLASVASRQYVKKLPCKLKT